MSFAEDVTNCPYCEQKDTYFSEYNCKTLETESHCLVCGYRYSDMIERNENGEYIYKTINYPMDECVLGTYDEEDKMFLYQKKLTEIDNLDGEFIFNWINEIDENEKYPIPDYRRNIYHITQNGVNRIIYYGNKISFDKKNNMVLIHYVSRVSKEEQGYGTITIKYKKGFFKLIPLNAKANKEQLLIEMKNLLKKNSDIVDIEVYIYDNEKKSLEQIKIENNGIL